MQVYITVPHARCFPEDYASFRHCDRASEEIATKLYIALKKLRMTVDVDASPDFRFEIDNNRWPARDYSWRQRVDRKLDRLSKKGPSSSWVLDMHSFPAKNDSGFGGEVVLLTHPWGDNRPTVEMAKYLQRRGVDTTVLDGAGLNDIQAKARTNGLTSTLVEVREGMPSQRYQEIATAMAEFLAQRNEMEISDILLSRAIE